MRGTCASRNRRRQRWQDSYYKLVNEYHTVTLTPHAILIDLYLDKVLFYFGIAQWNTISLKPFILMSFPTFFFSAHNHFLRWHIVEFPYYFRADSLATRKLEHSGEPEHRLSFRDVILDLLSYTMNSPRRSSSTHVPAAEYRLKFVIEAQIATTTSHRARAFLLCCGRIVDVIARNGNKRLNRSMQKENFQHVAARTQIST